ncbi:MAG: hypothetical protein IJY16_09015, partial [Clostridia bacterium]|nr:hypothetical protein [Clostridia bacterium]
LYGTREAVVDEESRQVQHKRRSPHPSADKRLPPSPLGKACALGVAEGIPRWGRLLVWRIQSARQTPIYHSNFDLWGVMCRQGRRDVALWGNDVVRPRRTMMFCSPSVSFICARNERKHHAAYAAHHCEAASLAEGEQSCALRAHKPQFGASDFYHLLPSPVEKTRN